MARRKHVLRPPLPLLLLLLFFMLRGASAALAAEEQSALEQLYKATNGPAWLDNSHWLQGDACAQAWFGVVCDMQGRHVTALLLHDNRLSGSLDDVRDLRVLSHLRVLWLAQNTLRGSLAFAASFPQLQELNVSHNQLSGPLPTSLSAVTSLTRVWVRGNSLSGPIPDAWASMPLESLKLEQNQICGAVPAWLMQRTWLRHAIDLSGNPFQCPLPEHPVLRQAGAHCSPKQPPACA